MSVVSAGWKLWTQQGAAGLSARSHHRALAVRHVFLARRKLQIATRSAAAHCGRCVESITCGWLAFVVIGAVVAQLAIGAGG